MPEYMKEDISDFSVKNEVKSNYSSVKESINEFMSEDNEPEREELRRKFTLMKEEDRNEKVKFKMKIDEQFKHNEISHMQATYGQFHREF